MKMSRGGVGGAESGIHRNVEQKSCHAICFQDVQKFRQVHTLHSHSKVNI